MTEQKTPPQAPQKPWRTALTEFDAHGIRIAGYGIGDMIRNLDFAGALFVLFQQRVPGPDEARMLNAALVSVIDHGIVPTSGITRIVAASGVPLQACIAAGILSVGDTHGGAGEQAARLLAEHVAAARVAGCSAADHAKTVVAEARARKERLEGFGHPMHPGSDERVESLLALARELGRVGPHMEMLLATADEIAAQGSRPIPINIDGILAAVLLDLGFDWRLARAFIIIPRSAGLAAHAVEEATRERGWRVVARADEIDYDGPAPRELPQAASR